jgi:trans-aconitate 2-methyltransferase
MTWNPEQYLKFAEPRLRPAIDLLTRINAANPAGVFDLGCGAGNVTRLLKVRWPDAQITGLDDSAEMLARAAKSVAGVNWVQQSLTDWRPEHPADVIYSNAALHWLPDHRTLFAKLVNQLAPGGVLAVQMPRNFGAPSHTTIAETVLAGPWRATLEPLLHPAPVAVPDVYYDLLSGLVKNLDIWESEYLQVLEGVDPVKEWTKGTWLKQFLDALDPTEAAAFEADYAARVRVAYPTRADGKTLFPFRRLFIVATR